MPAPIPLSFRPIAPQQPSPEPVRVPGVAEGLLASFRVVARDAPKNEEIERKQRLRQASWELVHLGALDPADAIRITQTSSAFETPDQYEHLFWSGLDKARRTNPKALPGWPGKREEFDQAWRAERNSTLPKDQAVSDASPWWTRVAGGVGATFTDPYQVATMPVGGGARTVLGKVFMSGITNALLEGAEQPLVARERQAQGRDYTASERATNIAFAFGGGVVLDAGGRGLARVVSDGPAVAPAGRRRVRARDAL